MDLTHSIANGNSPEPFRMAAGAYFHAGLSVFPCGKEDGKSPLVKWKPFQSKRPPESIIEKWGQGRFAGANVGFATGRVSGVTVIDVDDPARLDEVLREAGESPIIVQTPSGGAHVWYRPAGEANRNPKRDGHAGIDVRGEGGMALAPPSVRPDKEGTSYEFVQGDLGDLGRLPLIRRGALERLGVIKPGSNDNRQQKYDATPKECPLSVDSEKVYTGSRNSQLFSQTLRFARDIKNENDLTAAALDWNARNCVPPLPVNEALGTIRSALGYEREGRNWVGQEARTVVRLSELKALMDQPDALALLHFLRLMHDGRRAEFALVPEAVAPLIVWSKNRVRAARELLVERGFLELAHQGGGRGDPNRYRLATGRKPS